MKKIKIIVLITILITTANQSYADVWAEAVGASMGMALYNSQMILGMASDAKASKVYTDNEIKTIIN